MPNYNNFKKVINKMQYLFFIFFIYFIFLSAKIAKGVGNGMGIKVGGRKDRI